MEQLRKNYSVLILYDGKGKKSVLYREVHEGIEAAFDKPTDLKGRKLLDFVRKFSASNPDSRLTLEARNYR